MVVTELIDHPAAVADLASAVAAAPRVTFDTEFHSEKRYWPELCLVQVGIDGEAHLVDPLEADLTRLWEALTTGPEVVVHAGHADLAIVHRQHGRVPDRVFDTQLAAAFCAKGATAGYGNLVGAYLRQRLDKGPRMSDWRRRPLPDRQAAYAAADVTHLAAIHPLLIDDLTERGHLDYAVEEHARYLADERWMPTPPERAWQGLRTRTSNREVLNRFAHLAAWREREAARADKPRQWVLSDVTLADIAYSPPATPQAFRAVRNFPDRGAQRLVDALGAVLEEAAATPEDRWPVIPEPQPEPTEAATVLRVLRDHVATRTGIAAGLIATVGELHSLAVGTPDDHLVAGWRQEVFTSEADQVLSGDVALRLRDGTVVFE
jgi:ribonuclease D